MKILMLNHNLRGRGTWHRAWQFARGLAARGHGVTLWTAAPHHWYRAVHELRDGVRIVETPSWAPLAGDDDGWGPLDMAWRGAHAMIGDYDLCYAFAHPPTSAVPAWIARKLRGKPLLYDWCDWYAGGIVPKREAARAAGLGGPPPSGFQRRLERWELGLERRMPRLAGRVTVISERLREMTLAGGRAPHEVLLLPNAANLDGIPVVDQAAARAQWHLPSGGLLLGYAANYHPDQEFFLSALAAAARKVPTLRLLAGGPPFAPGLTERLGIAERVIEVGPVGPDRIASLLGAADVLAVPLEDHPSNIARVPVKFTDCLAAGRPIATTRVGDLTRHFELGEPPIGTAGAPTVEGYGDAIAGLFELGVDRAAMGRNARRLAETEYGLEGLTDRLEGFIAAWLGTAPPAGDRGAGAR